MNSSINKQKLSKVVHVDCAGNGSPVLRRKKMAGVTLQEFMMWAIITAGVAAFALFAFNRGSAGQAGMDLVKEFNELAANASNTYNGQWAQFSTTNAARSGLFRNFSSITDAGNGVVTLKGGGTLTVAPGQVQAANDSGRYTVAGLAEEVCKKFLLGVAGAAQTVSLNGTPVKVFGGNLDPTASCNATNNTLIVQKQ